MFDHKTIERLELGWLAIGVLLVVLLFVGVLASMVSETVPAFLNSSSRRIDASKLERTPFATPGLHRENGQWHAYILARAFVFQPAELKVPLGQPVTIHMTSADVVHGLQIESANINVELIPGQVALFKHTFTRAGSLVSACNEYCGISHHTMQFKLTVVPAEQLSAAPSSPVKVSAVKVSAQNVSALEAHP